MNQDIQPQTPAPERHPQFQTSVETPAIRPQAQSIPPQKKQGKGKTFLLAILGILLVVAAAVGGWYYGTSQAQKEADAQVAELNANIASLEKEKSALNDIAKVSAVDKNEGYMVIKEWGVRIKPTVSSMTYKIEKSVDGGSTVLLSNADAMKLGDSCGEEPGLAAISRYDKQQSSPGAGDYKGRIGNYYYYVSGANGLCSDNPKEPTIRNALLAAAQTVEPAQ